MLMESHNSEDPLDADKSFFQLLQTENAKVTSKKAASVQ